MELKIIQPTKFIQAIEFNFEELKEQLKSSLEKYQGLTFDDAQIKLAKTDRATLNKLKEAIENKRREIKQKCLKPYEEFEIKIKELVQLIDEPISNIDVQIKKFEEEQKLKKLSTITELFDKYAAETNIKELVTCQKIFNQRWLNNSYKLATIEQDIISITKQIADNIKVIEGIKTEFGEQVLDKYIQTLDLTAALAENTRLLQQKARLERMKAEEAKRQQEKQEQKSEPVPFQQPVRQTTKPIEIIEDRPNDEKRFQIDFRVWVTNQQKQLLRNFLIENKIKYGAVR